MGGSPPSKIKLSFENTDRSDQAAFTKRLIGGVSLPWIKFCTGGIELNICPGHAFLRWKLRIPNQTIRPGICHPNDQTVFPFPQKLTDRSFSERHSPGKCPENTGIRPVNLNTGNNGGAPDIERKISVVQIVMLIKLAVVLL